MPVFAFRLPPTRFLRTLLQRGVALWILSHIMAMATFAMKQSFAAGTAFESRRLDDPTLPIWALVMSASLIVVDLWRRKEITLLHNLGVATVAAVLVGLFPAFVGEALLMLIR